MTDRDWESEAKEQGWNPDYDGENKVDAKTFVEKGEKIAGILKSKVDKLEQRLTAAEQANRDFGEYTRKVREREQGESKQRIADLEAKLAQAITAGDGAEFTRLNGEINKEKENIQPANTNKGHDQLVEEFLKDNPWYQSDNDLQIYADGLSERIAHEGYRGKAYFKELTERVKARYPEKFGNPKKSGANSVETGGQLDTGSKKAHTYENLPKEDKAVCDRFVSQGFMTKDDYVAQYEWE
jgi:hypothetical protein